ncbi:MAG: hypothetical protein M3024_01275, partial [Candidatus Dormibacteraeota bacterium]|nr:hypothetical protein [Candidatus Dormibacteraeota bacterium]
MIHRLGLLRLGLARLDRQRVQSVALVVGLAAAIALAATVPLVQAEAAEVGLRSTVAGLGAKRFITVEQFAVTGPAQFDSFQVAATERVRGELGASAVPGASFAEFGPMPYSQVDGVPIHPDAGDPTPVVATYRDLARHVRVLSGAMPADEPAPAGADLPAAITADAAKTFEWKVGTEVCFPGIPPALLRGAVQRPGPCIRVAAVWTPANATDPYWGQDVPGLTAMIGERDFFSFAGGVFRTAPNAGRYFLPDVSGITPRSAAGVVESVNRLRGYFEVQRNGFFSTGLDAALRDLLQRQQAAAGTIDLVAAALLLIALYAVILAAAQHLRSQAGSLAVLRARGWSRFRVWALAAIQFGLLAAVALPIGLAAAGVATAAAARVVYGRSATGLVGSDLAGLGPPLGLTLGAVVLVLAVVAAAGAGRDVLGVRRDASRAAASPWWRRGRLDLLLALLALPLLAGARLLPPAPGESQSLATLLLPAAALALLAVASLRLLPLAAAVARRVGGTVGDSLAAWQLSRSAEHVPLALLLTFTVAIGVFSATFAAT